MEFQNYINGKWVEGRNKFQTINPANEELLAEIAQAEISDVDAAVSAATEAFKSWRLVPAPLRGELLFKIGDILKQKKEELAQLLTQDMGKVISEARGDVQEAIDMAYFMGGEGRRLLGYTAPVEMPNKFGMAVRDPAGVVGLITPWNFPIAVPSWKIFPALVAGNTVIWKPSPETPAISAAFVKVFEEAGLPAGVFNLLLAPGAEVGKGTGRVIPVCVSFRSPAQRQQDARLPSRRRSSIRRCRSRWVARMPSSCWTMPTSNSSRMRHSGLPSGPAVSAALLQAG